MYCCDKTEVDKFIEQVRRLAERNKLVLLAVDPDEGQIMERVTLPMTHACTPPSRGSDDRLPPLNIPATEIVQSVCVSLVTFKADPKTTLLFSCSGDGRGSHNCDPPF